MIAKKRVVAGQLNIRKLSFTKGIKIQSHNHIKIERVDDVNSVNKILRSAFRHYTKKVVIPGMHITYSKFPKIYIFTMSKEKDFYKIPISRNLKLFMYAFSTSRIKCDICSCKATHYWIEQNKSHSDTHNLALYSDEHRYGEVMFTLDHIHPKSMGGRWDITNMRILCEVCNSERGNRVDTIV